MQVQLDEIVDGGQAIGTLETGQKAFVWNGLPGELVDIQVTKKKSRLVEGIAHEITNPSPDRIPPKEPASYLSTSPWQIMTPEAEQKYKSQLVHQALRLHHVDWHQPIEVFGDENSYGYRNKIEFSWYGDIDTSTGLETLDLAFFRRGSRGKIAVQGSELARPEINRLGLEIRNLLRTKPVIARNLKTLIIRSNQQGDCVWQLYTKDRMPDLITSDDSERLSAQGGEVIFSNPKSPASVITERLTTFGDTTLIDTILGVPFRYNAESFFQVNLPVYQQALQDMKNWIPQNTPTVDMYSGVGTIGLTIGGDDTALIEINEHAVKEMQRNITELGKTARAILSPSEQALGAITHGKTIILDPPRAGLHPGVVERILEVEPGCIVYLSCNPVTQARDASLLLEKYEIIHIHGYNFFPRTPHIENLIVLQRKA